MTALDNLLGRPLLAALRLGASLTRCLDVFPKNRPSLRGDSQLDFDLLL